MKRKRLLESIGFGYIANHNSKEGHKVSELESRCNVEAMTNAGYCTWLWMMILIKFFNYDGCHWCNKKHHSK